MPSVLQRVSATLTRRNTVTAGPRLCRCAGRALRGQTVIASQVPTATMTTTMMHQITGETRFELPLRGESFAAWLNS